MHFLQGVLIRNLCHGQSHTVIIIPESLGTVKTLYNVTRYNRIFNIRHKFPGNRSVPINIPSL